MTIAKLLGGAAAVALIAATPVIAADLIVDVPVYEPVAVSDTGWYLSIFGGAYFADSIEADDGSPAFGQYFDFDSDMGWTIGAAVGAQLTENFRGEVELSTGMVDLTGVTISGFADPINDFSSPLADGSASATYLLANVWFDIPTGSGFTPYIGGGLGAAYVKATGTLPAPLNDEIDLEGWGWAYQVGAGVKVDVADNIALDLGYRYKAIVDADLEGNGDDAIADIGSHVVQVGLTFGF